MNETAAPTDTYCLGRFLIDVPIGSKLSGGNYEYQFTRIEEPLTTTLEQFKGEIKSREEKLRSTKHEKDPNLLRSSQSPDEATRVLALWEDDYSEYAVNVEGYKWAGGLRFLLQSRADPDKQKIAVTQMVDRLSTLRARTDVDIPKDAGFCFAGGFFANDVWQKEEALVNIDIAGHPDAFITVWIFPTPLDKRSKSLSERMAVALLQLGLYASGIQVLRQGDRQVGPIKGHEFLATGPNSGGKRAHMFTWESPGEGTYETPSIEIKLETGHQDDKGNPQQTHLTDEQAIELWDRIVKSFRLRPVDAAPKTSEAKPQIPLGALASTGRICPQTGWWQAAEEGLPVRGGESQLFREGEVMPHAVLLAEGSLWQKLKGEVPTYTVTTVWKLVAHEQPDAPPQG